jgi:hypothetical protein
VNLGRDGTLCAEARERYDQFNDLSSDVEEFLNESHQSASKTPVCSTDILVAGHGEAFTRRHFWVESTSTRRTTPVAQQGLDSTSDE